MRRLLAALPVVLMLLAGCGATEPPPPPPPPAPVTPTVETTAGEWAGRIGIPGSPVEIGIRLTAENGGLRGEIDIPAQAIEAMPLSDVLLEGREFSFRLPEVGGDAWFRGTFEADGKSIPGAFTQFGQSYPLVLRPGPPAGRPQEPKPPFPYRSEDVTYPGAGVDLAGTLTTPEGPGPFTAVVLATGSGPQDRNQEIFGHKPFLLLADLLTRAGYAVLRVDDRGVGGSGGQLLEANYDQLTDDLVAGVAFLRGRPEINRDRIGVLGHSEGGYLAPLVAQRTPIAFVIMLAGPAATGEEVLAAQNQLLLESVGAPPELVQNQVAYVHVLVSLLREEDYDRARALAVRQLVSQATAMPPEEQPAPEQIQAQVDATVNPYYRSWAVHDPAPALQALRVPVLAVFGAADLQVPAGQNEPLMRSHLAGNPDSTVRTLPGLNHMMQPANNGGPDEYGTIDTTIDPSALELVRSWLTQRFPR